MKLEIQFSSADRIADALEGIDHSLRKLALRLPLRVMGVQHAIEELVKVLTPPKASVIRFYVDEGGKQTEVSMLILKDDAAPKKLVLAFKDAKGNAASVDGVPAWSVTDPNLGTLAVADDGMSATVAPVGALGSFQVNVTADADLGEGVTQILGTLDCQIIGGDAVEVDITPVDDAPAPAPAP